MRLLFILQSGMYIEIMLPENRIAAVVAAAAAVVIVVVLHKKRNELSGQKRLCGSVIYTVHSLFVNVSVLVKVERLSICSCLLNGNFQPFYIFFVAVDGKADADMLLFCKIALLIVFLDDL